VARPVRFACFIAHPFGLGGCARQELECFQPLTQAWIKSPCLPSFFAAAAALHSGRARSEWHCGHNQGAGRECTRAVFAIFN